MVWYICFVNVATFIAAVGVGVALVPRCMQLTQGRQRSAA